MRIFSDKSRPIHAGHFPVELLSRQAAAPDLSSAPAFKPLSFDVPDAPHSIINAMREHQAMLDAIGRADHVEPHGPRIGGVPIAGVFTELDRVVR